MIQQLKYIQAEQVKVKRPQKTTNRSGSKSESYGYQKKAIDYRRGSYQFTTRRKWKKRKSIVLIDGTTLHVKKKRHNLNCSEIFLKSMKIFTARLYKQSNGICQRIH